MTKLDDIRSRVKIDAKTGTVTLPTADVSFLLNECELRNDVLREVPISQKVISGYSCECAGENYLVIWFADKSKQRVGILTQEMSNRLFEMQRLPLDGK